MLPIEQPYILSFFKKRNNQSHKGDHGHALIIAGSHDKMGAALIASKACLRSGVGLLTAMIPNENLNSLFIHVPEAMCLNQAESHNFNEYNAIGIGPGLGVNEYGLKLVQSLFETNTSPVVFDADALNIISEYQIGWKNFKSSFILTPHPKEFDRLFGMHFNDDERKQTAIEKAKELNCVIVLKGHRTFITDGQKVFYNTTGNAGLAKGGSGDALTGMITAFLAQGYTTLEASLLGVFVHGLAADITLKDQSEESMLITDVIANIGKAFKQMI